MPIPGHSDHQGSVTFVLEEASLTLAYIGKRYQILSSDEHADYLRKKKLNPYDYRPDIVHEVSLLFCSFLVCIVDHFGLLCILHLCCLYLQCSHFYKVDGE
ncbi:unnamed protein product [Cuscuta campestris]|nr:unnamed protein product [Cuscuta campestris]